MDANHDLKTTITGIIAGLFTILATCGVHIPGIIQSQTVEGIIAGVAVVVLGFFTNKTPASEDQTKQASLSDADKAAGQK